MVHRDRYPNFDPSLFTIGNKILDFGPDLSYERICTAYTVEKISLWTLTTEDEFELVALKAHSMPKARAEGILYRMSDEEVKYLDKVRQIGVKCARRRVAIYVPFRDHRGDLVQTYAWIYEGLRRYWVDLIEMDDMTGRCGNIRQSKPAFQLAQSAASDNKTLHNRFCLNPPPLPTPVWGDPPQAVIDHCYHHNRRQARSRWLKHFLSDEF